MQILTALAFEAFLTGLVLISASRSEGHQSRLRSALLGAVEAFLDTGIFFSLSVFIAAVIALRHFGEGEYYDPSAMSTIFTFTVGPLLVIVSLHLKQLRRRVLRVGIVVILALLSHVLFWMAQETMVPATGRWVDICCPQASLLGGSMVAAFAWINLLLTALLVHQFITPTVLYYPNLFFRPRLWGKIFKGNTFRESFRSLEAERWESRRYRDSFCLPGLFFLLFPFLPPFGRRLATFSFFFTCLQLLFIFCQRSKLENCAKGEVYKENQLSFGQTLAALMWLPVFADFGDIFFCKS